jgi:polar amino acid transport system permease protein
MIEFSIWDILRNLALSARWTIGLSLTAFLFGGLGGLAVLAARLSHRRWLHRAANTYIEFFQGTPLLLQLFMIFFGIALLGVDVPPWLAAALGLTFFSSAYLAEIWRGCVQAIPKGQWEASSSLAMSWFEQMRHVILPQALRIAVAPTVGFSVQIVKSTAVTSIIGFTELTKTGSMLANATFQPFTVFGLVALGYFILCYPLSLFASYLERKFRVSSAH